MGLIRDIGNLAGALTGTFIGAPISLVGEIVESDFLKQVGNGVFKASQHTGDLLGNVTEGIGEAVYGTVTSDNLMQSRGFEKVLDSGATYVTGVAKGVGKLAVSGAETVGAILDGDTDKALKVGKEVAKTVAIGTLAVGVLDVLDNVDLFNDVDDTAQIVENPNTHHVTPHTRVYNGKEIWVDGDGDTSVDTYEGWYQRNPDYRA